VGRDTLYYSKSFLRHFLDVQLNPTAFATAQFVKEDAETTFHIPEWGTSEAKVVVDEDGAILQHSLEDDGASYLHSALTFSDLEDMSFTTHHQIILNATVGYVYAAICLTKKNSYKIPGPHNFH